MDTRRARLLTRRIASWNAANLKSCSIVVVVIVRGRSREGGREGSWCRGGAGAPLVAESRDCPEQGVFL